MAHNHLQSPVSVIEVLVIDRPNQILGSPKISDTLARLIDDTRRKKGSIFDLVWEGDKTPRGTVIGSQVVGWTQNGVVLALDGETMIGTYERLEEFGGPNGTSHRMRIRTFLERGGQ